MVIRQCKRDLQAMEARRREAMCMLKHGVTQADIARELEVSRQTVSIWAKRLAEDPCAWQRRPLGKPGVLTTADKTRLGKLLRDGAVVNGFPTELWTLSRVGQLIAREFGPSYSDVHVMRLLRELGFSSLKPGNVRHPG